MVSSSYATIRHNPRLEGSELIARIKEESGYNKKRTQYKGYQPRLVGTFSERQRRSKQGSKLRQRPEQTIASVSGGSLYNLQSYTTLPHLNTRSLEIDRKNPNAMNDKDRKELLEIVRRQQLEIDELKNQLDTVTVKS